MKRKWTCPSCFQGFSRWWNLNRHSENIHGQSLERQENQYRSLNISPNKPPKDNFDPNSNDSSIIDRSISEMQNLARMNADLARLKESYSGSSQIYPNQNFLKDLIDFYKRQFERLVSENWIISKNEIKGISAYVCNRCSTFNSKLIVDPTYDMTMQRKHRCGHADVKGNQIAIPFQPGVTDIEKWSVEILVSQMNFCIPGVKYMVIQDISNVFDSLARSMEYDRVMSLLGIPDRVYKYSLEKNDEVGWIDRGLRNVGGKTELEKFEIRDFLGRVKSTYAIFEIPKSTNLKRFYMKLTV